MNQSIYTAILHYPQAIKHSTARIMSINSEFYLAVHVNCSLFLLVIVIVIVIVMIVLLNQQNKDAESCPTGTGALTGKGGPC